MIGFAFEASAGAMNRSREFAQGGITYADGPQHFLVRSGYRHPTGQSGLVTQIIVMKTASQASTSSRGSALTDAVTATAIGAEITATTPACGAMIITAGVMVSGAFAMPIMAGGSAALVVNGYAGAAATGLSCLNGIYRAYGPMENSGDNVAWLDAQERYAATSASRT